MIGHLRDTLLVVFRGRELIPFLLQSSMLLQASDRPNVRPVAAPSTIPPHAFAARAYHLMTYVLYALFVRAHASLMLRGCPAAIQILISHVF
jgi:hypothetical protein